MEISEQMKSQRESLLKRHNYPEDGKWITDGHSWLTLYGDYVLHVVHLEILGRKPMYFWYIRDWSGRSTALRHYTDVCEPDGWAQLEQAQETVLNAFRRHIRTH